jgi:hypothetical protein
MKPGLYAVEVYFGWKILQRHEGGWWHVELTGRWTASEPVQWVGPLPERIAQNSKPKAKLEFDL